MVAKTQDEANRTSQLGFIELWSIIWNRRRLVAATVGFSWLLGVVIALIRPPIFRAETLLAPIPDPSVGNTGLGTQLGSVVGIAGIGPSGTNSVDKAKAILSSRAFIVDVIEEHGIARYLFADYWDEMNSTWKIENGVSVRPSTSRIHSTFSRIFFVTESARTRLVTVAIEWTDRDLGRAMGKMVL